MCQFSSCHPFDKSSRALFQQLSPETAAAVQGGYWAHHLNNVNHTSLASISYDSEGYGGPSPLFSSPSNITSVKESQSTYGYSYGYGTHF